MATVANGPLFLTHPKRRAYFVFGCNIAFSCRKAVESMDVFNRSGASGFALAELI
jgi:hypothetical protein